MRHEESRIQTACVRWFRLEYPRYRKLLFSVPNGGARTATEGRILKAEGTLAGVSDLLLLLPNKEYHGLCIEMKTEKGRQADTQKAFQRAVEMHNYKYIICRSLDDFIEQIKRYIEI